MFVSRWWLGRGVDVGTRAPDLVLPLEPGDSTDKGTSTQQTAHQRQSYPLSVVQAALVCDTQAHVIGWDWVFLGTYASVHAPSGDLNLPPKNIVLPPYTHWAMRATWRLSDAPFSEPAPNAEIWLWLTRE